MIKLSKAIVIANTSEELVALEELLATSYPEFIFSIEDNVGEEKETFPFRLLVEIDNSVPDMTIPSMPEFFILLMAKIDKLNQTT
jgi:hypothetical protein